MELKEQIGQMIPDSGQKAGRQINADVMSVEEIHQKLEAGYQDAKNGNVRNAAEAFAEFRQQHETG